MNRLGCLAVLAAALGPSLSCGPGKAPGPGIALITVEGWRADAAGFLGAAGLTPTLDRLAERAEWAGPALASAAASGPALASLLTGLGPWRHQVLTRIDALPAEAITLAEALAQRGYRARAFRGKTEASARAGFSQGAGSWQALRSGEAAREALASLGPGEFVWIHLTVVDEEYRRRDRYLSRLPASSAGDAAALPVRIRRGKLMRRVTPARPLSLEAQDELRALYLSEVARTDEILATLLDGWERGAARQGTALAVVGTRGEELGENGWVGDGRTLARGALAVPLVVDLPGTSRPSGPGVEWVGTDRLWATLYALTGAEPPAGVAAGLFAPAAPGVLSELYGEAGRNEFSWVEGRGQYLRTVRFADDKARRGRGRGSREARLERRRRQERVFRHTLPWSAAAPGVRIERRWTPWSEIAGTVVAPVSAELDRLDAAVRARWLLFSGPEVTPAERAVLY